MDRTDARKRAIGIMARIQAATARHDPSYRKSAEFSMLTT